MNKFLCFEKEEKTVIDIHKTSLPFIQSLDIRSRREQENHEQFTRREKNSTNKKILQSTRKNLAKKKKEENG